MKTNDSLEIIPLASGAKLLYITDPTDSLSAISVWLRAGSRFDPISQEGLSHFFEHLLMTRTKHHQKKSERMFAIESIGIESNAFTNYEVAYYSHIQTKESLLSSLDLFLDGLFESVFDESDVAHERNIILDESTRNFSDPAQYMWQLSSRGLWPDSCLGRNFFGDADSLNNITLDDIKTFQKKFYVPSNMYFVLIGQEKDKQQAIEMIQKKCSLFPSETKRETIDAFPYMKPMQQILDVRPSLDQVTIGINYRTAPLHEFERNITEDVLRSYLAFGWTSRLIQKLRDEYSLTYWVNGVLENFSDTGWMRFELSTEKKNVTKVLEIINNEIAKITAGNIDIQALETTKKMMTTSLTRHYADISNKLYFYGWPFVFEIEPLSLPEYFSHVQSIKKERLVAEAQKIFSTTPTIAMIGNV